MRTESSQHQYKSQLDRIAFDYLGQEDWHDYIFSDQAAQKHQPRQKNILVLQNEIKKNWYYNIASGQLQLHCKKPVLPLVMSYVMIRLPRSWKQIHALYSD